MNEPEDINSQTAILDVMDTISTFLDAAAGHRNKAIESGFSAAAAEHMAVDLHSHLIDAAFRSTSPPITC